MVKLINNMSYLPLQVIVTIFSVFVIYRLIKKFKDKTLKLSEFITWFFIWLIVLVVFWLPETTSYLAFILGIGRGVDLAVYIAILLIFYLIFKLYLKADKQQKEITKLVRHLALNEEENKE